MTDTIDLAGKIAIVTGAASGMGAVMAGALLAAGARVRSSLSAPPDSC